MPSASRDENPDAEALQFLHESFPEPDDEELVEQRPEEGPPEDAPRPLHDPWWIGGDVGHDG